MKYFKTVILHLIIDLYHPAYLLNMVEQAIESIAMRDS
jgi:hypothetical protein